MEKIENSAVESESKEESMKEGFIGGFESLDRLLKSSLKPEVFQEVSQLILGLNCGGLVERLPLPDLSLNLSSQHDFDLQAFCFHAEKEQLRPPRVVRVGVIQNHIALPATSPFMEQKIAIMQKVKPMIDAAGASGVNILCLQEAWTMPFAFCTREKRWCEFAEPIDGESTQFLQEFARKYNMVIKASSHLSFPSSATAPLQHLPRRRILPSSSSCMLPTTPPLPTRSPSPSCTDELSTTTVSLAVDTSSRSFNGDIPIGLRNSAVFEILVCLHPFFLLNGRGRRGAK